MYDIFKNFKALVNESWSPSLDNVSPLPFFVKTQEQSHIAPRGERCRTAAEAHFPPRECHTKAPWWTFFLCASLEFAKAVAHNIAMEGHLHCEQYSSETWGHLLVWSRHRRWKRQSEFLNYRPRKAPGDKPSVLNGPFRAIPTNTLRRWFAPFFGKGDISAQTVLCVRLDPIERAAFYERTFSRSWFLSLVTFTPISRLW